MSTGSPQEDGPGAPAAGEAAYRKHVKREGHDQALGGPRCRRAGGSSGELLPSCPPARGPLYGRRSSLIAPTETATGHEQRPQLRKRTDVSRLADVLHAHSPNPKQSQMGAWARRMGPCAYPLTSSRILHRPTQLAFRAYSTWVGATSA